MNKSDSKELHWQVYCTDKSLLMLQKNTVFQYWVGKANKEGKYLDGILKKIFCNKGVPFFPLQYV